MLIHGRWKHWLFSLRTIIEHLELELTEKELDRTHRIGNPKSGNKRARQIVVKFALTVPEERFL